MDSYFEYNVEMRKILITGGHLAPALAIIEELKKEKRDIEIVFVGRKYSLDSEKTISLEFREIEKLGIPFIPLSAGRLTRVMTFRSIRNFLRIPLGFFSAFFILRDQRPDIILSFGSFLALPVAFWGYVFKIPVYSHEQTIKPGLANRLISHFSKIVFVAFSEAKKYFDPSKTLVSGNPVRNAIFEIRSKPFEIDKNKPVIYVTGGSLGSHSINLHIQKILTDLLSEYIVIHQVGDTKEYGDFEKLQEVRNNLPQNLASNYYLRKHFLEDEIGYIYSLTDLCVGRSGANTFFELQALKIPALLIPLPWSAGREQQKHAEIFAREGVGEIFHQVESSGKLLRQIKSMISNLDAYKKNFEKLDYFYKQNAAKFLVKTILK